MRRWLDNYYYLSSRLRSLSVTFAVAVAIITALDSYSFYSYVIQNGHLLQSIEYFRFEYLFPTLTLCFVVVRIYGLVSATSSRVASYAWIAVGLLLITRLLVEYVNVRNAYQPNCDPESTNVCFGIYELKKEPISTLITFVYIVGGIVKTSTVGTIAFFWKKKRLA